MGQKVKPKLLILTGPQGSGNHLFAKIFSSHKSVYGWKMKHNEWKGHHEEPFSLYWRKPELLKEIKTNVHYWFSKTNKKHYVTSISCPYFYRKKPTIPNYEKFIKCASTVFKVQICIIGRDKNILYKQQTRIRSKHTTPTAIKNFKHLLKYNPVFISQELFCLYGIDYCNSISKLGVGLDILTSPFANKLNPCKLSTEIFSIFIRSLLILPKNFNPLIFFP